jgi:ribosomal protein S10
MAVSFARAGETFKIQSLNRSPAQPINGLLLANTPPKQIKPSQGIHVASLHFRTHGPNRHRMDLAVEFARRAAAALNMPCSNVSHLPTRTELQTVPSGPFVHKKAQENYWRKTHKRMLQIWDADERVVGVWLQYLAKHALPGVAYKSQQFVFRPLGFGREIRPVGAEDQASTEEQVQAQVDEIVEQFGAILSVSPGGEGDSLSAAHAPAETQQAAPASTSQPNPQADGSSAKPPTEQTQEASAETDPESPSDESTTSAQPQTESLAETTQASKEEAPKTASPPLTASSASESQSEPQQEEVSAFESQPEAIQEEAPASERSLDAEGGKTAAKEGKEAPPTAQ